MKELPEFYLVCLFKKYAFKSIDIVLLVLVFFYVLSEGTHPLVTSQNKLLIFCYISKSCSFK